MDLFGDIFGRGNLPEGSVVLLGSVSHLHKQGISQFTREWTRMVMSMGRSWPTVRVAPLVPLIREDAPGRVVRELTEVAVWFSRVYNGNIPRMGACWTLLLEKSIGGSEGGMVLTNPRNYIITLPASLEFNDCSVPHTFVTKRSCPLVLKGIDKGTQGIRTFLAYMHGRPIYFHDNCFLLIARLILILKGYRYT